MEEETEVETEVVEEETNSLYFTRTDDSDNNGWKISPSELLQGTIVGRGENASEEGIATFVVKNNETNSTTTFELGHTGVDKQYTPKAFEWIDDERVYIIIGYAYGSVSKGGDLYEFNLTDHTLTPVLEDLESNKEVISIKKGTDGSFVYEKQLYDIEFYDNEFIEKGKITPSSK